MKAATAVPSAVIPPSSNDKKREGAPQHQSALMSLGGELFEAFFQSIVEQLESSDGFNEEQTRELANYLQANNAQIVAKRDRLGEFLARLNGEAEAIRTEEKRLGARRANFEKIAECMKSSIHTQMLDSGVKKVEGKLFSFALQKNPPSVQIDDENVIPPEFLKWNPQIDKAAIKDALAEGKEVTGAHLVTDKTHLRIR